MRLVIVDNYDSFTFNLLQMLGELAGERPLVFKNDEVGPREIEACSPDGVVLSPGPGHPRDAGRLIEIVRDLDPTIPVLGVCLGHQAIVEAEGGKVLSAGVIMHGKTSEVFHSGGRLLEGIPSPFIATRYHSLVAEKSTLPSTLRPTGHTSDGLIMTVDHTTRPVYGVQFHPESLATGVGGTILANFVAVCQGSAQPMQGARAARVELALLIERVLDGNVLSRDVARSIGEQILSGAVGPAQVGALAIALRVRGEDAEEVAGLALAFRSAVTPVPTSRQALNIAGTGGDRQTFNISTAAAIVAAGAGVPVAKAVAQTGSVGSEDVAMALGIPLDLNVDEVARSLDEVGLAFYRAIDLHTALRHVPRPDEIGNRTIFGLVAPLLNAAGANRHLIGVHTDSARGPIARALKELGAVRAMVVRGADGMDELTTTAVSHIAELRSDGSIVERVLDPRDLGIARGKLADLRGGDAAANAQIILDVLDGSPSPQRDVVVLNAAAALMVAGAAMSFELAIARCVESITSGAALAVLERTRSFRLDRARGDET